MPKLPIMMGAFVAMVIAGAPLQENGESTSAGITGLLAALAFLDARLMVFHAKLMAWWHHKRLTNNRMKLCACSASAGPARLR
jgi:hypothetical protein